MALVVSTPPLAVVLLHVGDDDVLGERQLIRARRNVVIERAAGQLCADMSNSFNHLFVKANVGLGGILAVGLLESVRLLVQILAHVVVFFSLLALNTQKHEH